MKKLIIKTIAIGLGVFFLVAQAPAVYADERGSGFASPSEEKEGGRIPTPSLPRGSGELVGETLVSPIAEAIKNKIKRGTKFILGIETQIQNSREELMLLKKNKRELIERIETSKVRVESLQSQLENLAQLIEHNTKKIHAVRLQIAETENRIEILKDDVSASELEIETHMQSFETLMLAYYMHTTVFFGYDGETPQLMSILAESGGASEAIRDYDYLGSLPGTNYELVEQINKKQDILDIKQNNLQEEEKKLRMLKDILNGEQRDLKAAEQSQKRLLEETQGKQLIYETLLELSKKEETQVALQIERLKENFQFFQEKLDELQKNPGAFGIAREDILESYDESLSLAGNASLAWPVTPALGLSALFRDSAYKKAIGIEHNAIDIRVIQGSPVRSAGNGVVSKVADNDMAYSYVIIAHPGNILTLYGHLSDIMVTEGEIVKQGQTIGLSGGMPGTKGAGWLTTGPHLHFEVFQDWKHVDPLDYLPLELVPIASLPEKYLDRLTGKLSF